MRTVKSVLLPWLFVLVILSVAGRASLHQVPHHVSESHATVRATVCTDLHVDLDSDSQADDVVLTNVTPRPQLEVTLSTHATLIFVLHPETSLHGTVVAADIDHDGDIDLLVQSGPFPRDVSIWLGDGAGGFEYLQLQEQRQLALDWCTNHLAQDSGSQTPFVLISQHELSFAQVHDTRDTTKLSSYRTVPLPTSEAFVTLFLQCSYDRGPPLLSC